MKKNKLILKLLWIPAGLLVVAGCLTVGPDYEKPEVPLSDSWSTAVTNSFQSGTNTMTGWWKSFNDETLDRLIVMAGTNSPDLKIAAERIEESAALRGVSKSYWFPQIAADGTVTRLRASEKAYSTLPPGENKATYYSVGGTMGWELDLWGRVRRMVESSDAALQASLEDYRDTLVILYGEVAYQYVTVRTLQSRIALTEKSVAMREETLKMTESRNKAGLAPDLDLYQARMSLSQSRAMLPPLRIMLAAAVHRLGVLTGRDPSALREMLSVDGKIPVPPEKITVGVPADMLRQRPDVRSAERRLAAQTALIGVKRAELYPTLTLPGVLRLEAYSAGDLGSDALTYGFGPGLRWNLFSGGRIRSEIKAEESRTRQAYLNYKRTVLKALEDVENAMVSIRQERMRLDELQRTVKASEKSVELVTSLYKAGLTDFQNVLSMEQALTQHENDLAGAQGNIALYTVQLYKAFGGGWEETDSGDGKDAGEGQQSGSHDKPAQN